MSSKTILVVDDEKLVRWPLRQQLEGAGYQVVEAENALEARQQFEKHLPDLVTLDVRLPDDTGLKVLLDFKKLAPATPVIMITAFGAVEDAVKSLRIGAYDYLEKPINFDRLLHSISNALETRALKSEVERTRKREKQTNTLDRIVGSSPATKNIKRLVATVASSQASTILIQGESGTGKDLVAKALHYESDRSKEPFTIINCAAIPDQLLETELFGHERGAFTDAKTMKKGLLELSDGGTLFFDEIGEMQENLQAKILRVMEDRTFRRVGGIKDMEVDLRVICATNQNLEELVAEKGGFREDLYYRLAVMPIFLPPLRDRPGDIPELVAHFVSQYNEQFRKSIAGVSRKALRLLEAYHWPGNVRELKNTVERAMILLPEGTIGEDLIGPWLNSRTNGFHKSSSSTLPLAEFPKQGVDLYEIEKELIRQGLMRASGNQSKAARLLSISRDTLRYKMKKYGLPRLPDPAIVE